MAEFTYKDEDNGRVRKSDLANFYSKPSDGIPPTDLAGTYAGSQTAGGTANKTSSIPFGKLDSTSTATVMTATIDGITELRNGICMFLMNGVVTSTTNFTININGLGAKPVYSTMAAATRAATIFNVAYTGFFVYNEERVSGGCWDFYYGYNSDTNTVGYNVAEYYNGTKRVKTAMQRYQLLLTCFDGYLLPVYSGTYSTGTAKVLTTESFNPLGEVYYYNTTTVLAEHGVPAAGSLCSQAAYTLVDLRYSFNTGTTLIAGNDVYLVCVPQIDGSAVLHSSPIAFSLPTAEDGLLYKRLGKAYDTYRLVLEQHKPVYYYKNGSIREWTGVDSFDSLVTDTTFTFQKADVTGNVSIESVKGNTIVWNQLNTNKTISYYYTEYVTITASNGLYTITPADTTETKRFWGSSNFTTISGRKYACCIWTNLPVNSYLGIGYNATKASADAAKSYGLGYWGLIGNIQACTDTTGYFAVYCTSQTAAFTVAYPCVFDLTAMFGVGKEPSTFSEFRNWLFSKIGLSEDYAAASATLINAISTGIKTVGFNQWDEEWEEGTYSTTTGSKLSVGGQLRCKNKIPILPNTTYNFKGVEWFMFFDANGDIISNYDRQGKTTSNAATYLTDGKFITPSNAASMVFYRLAAYGTTYNHDICINISNPSKNGTYEPYWSETKALPITTMTGKVNGQGSSEVIFPDGLKRAGSVYDEIYTDAQGVTRAIKRIGKVDLGTLTWVNSSTTRHYVADFSVKARGVNAISAKYPTYMTPSFGWDMGDKKYDVIGFQSTSDYLYIRTLATYTDAATFKTAMSGVYLYYELATPVEYIVDDFTLPVTVKMDEWGTKLMLPENTSTVTTISPYLTTKYLEQIDSSTKEYIDTKTPLWVAFDVIDDTTVCDTSINTILDALEAGRSVYAKIIGLGYLVFRVVVYYRNLEENVAGFVVFNWISTLGESSVAVPVTYEFVGTIDDDVDVWTVTEHEAITNEQVASWDAKQSALVSGTNIKTINNTSLLGSGNISIQENVQSDWNATTGNAVILNKPTIPSAPGTLVTNNTTAQTASSSEALSGTINLHKVSKTGTYSDLIGTPTNVSTFTNDAGYATEMSLETISSSTTSTTLSNVNTYYRHLSTGLTSLAVTLPSTSGVTTAQHIMLYIKTGASPTFTVSATGNSTITYVDGFAIEANTEYEISFLWNGAKWIVAYNTLA